MTPNSPASQNAAQELKAERTLRLPAALRKLPAYRLTSCLQSTVAPDKNCSLPNQLWSVLRRNFLGDSMSKIKVAVLGLAALAQAGCASSPGSIEARYVSPTTYQNWTCPQLFDEKVRLSREVERVSGLQRENANADTALMTVGIIIFWPALFGLAATKDRKEELSRLKGEYEAVDSNITSKQCSAPAPGTPSTANASGSPAPTLSLSGTYSGKGTTDSYCQTPSLSISIADSAVTGFLSEVSNGTTTGTITGTVEPGGQLVAMVKSVNPANVSGTFRGTVNPTVLNIEMKQPAPNDCHYKFSIPKK